MHARLHTAFGISSSDAAKLDGHHTVTLTAPPCSESCSCDAMAECGLWQAKCLREAILNPSEEVAVRRGCKIVQNSKLRRCFLVN
eukprot:6039660-Amphidinium_carterae.1